MPVEERDFQAECDEIVDNTVKELQDIYEGKVESQSDDYDDEKMTLYEYLDNILDVNYTISSRGEYRSASICIACGGPNIYIDTDDAYVKLYWGGTRAQAPISYNVRDEIDAIMEEWYELIR